MSEYIIKLPNGGAADECIRLRGYEKSLYGYELHEEIVRCRDCVAYVQYLTLAGMKLDYGECMQHRRQTDDDRFCWWAERSDR